MTAKLSRRQVLRTAALGGTAWLLAACASSAEQPVPTAPQAAAAPPTSAPPAPPTNTSAPPTRAAVPTGAAPTTAAAPVPATAAPSPTPANEIAILATGISQAATQFLAALDDGGRAKATYAFDDAERLRWHWTTPRGFPRNGLSLSQMNEEQRALGLALLRASVSEAGYAKALDIMALQNELGNDPQEYYVSVFGTPGGAERWGWRFEGHHLSRHFTVFGEQMAAMPFFNGSWPNITDSGMQAMKREEEAARELIQSLDERARGMAIFRERTLTNHVTQNEAYVSALEPVGIALNELSSDQQGLAVEIIQTYLRSLSDSLAAPDYERIRAAGLENIRFGWAGNLEPRRPHYYRLQGPTFLLEFDNSRNGGTHIHSVWRDFERDFGQTLA